MKLLAFAVYDRAARAYSAPFYQHTRGLGERMFADLVVDPQSNVSKHPGDYELFCVGEFDNEEGVLSSPDKPLLLVTGVQVLSLKAVNDG